MSKHEQARRRGWTGDLDDDCFIRRYGYKAHVEKMDRGVWWLAVYRDHQNVPAESLFNSADMHSRCAIPSGSAARCAAELIMECLRERNV